jgi:hypothetical protein
MELFANRKGRRGTPDSLAMSRVSRNKNTSPTERRSYVVGHRHVASLSDFFGVSLASHGSILANKFEERVGVRGPL